MAQKTARQKGKVPLNKRPVIKSGTLVIVTNLNSNRKHYECGIVVRHTVGLNWLIATFGGNRIYPEPRVCPILETDNNIIDVDKAWNKYLPQFLGAVVEMSQKWWLFQNN